MDLALSVTIDHAYARRIADHPADLVRSASGKHSYQACVIRSLGEAMSRLAKDGSLLRTSKIIGGLIPRLLDMERAQENIVIAA